MSLLSETPAAERDADHPALAADDARDPTCAHAAAGHRPNGRRRLPDRRMSLTVGFEHEGQRYHLTVGFHGDGAVGEVFLDGPKVGSERDSHLDDEAVLASRLIQHGELPHDIAKGLTKGTAIRRALQIAAAIQAGGPAAPLPDVAA